MLTLLAFAGAFTFVCACAFGAAYILAPYMMARIEPDDEISAALRGEG